MKQVTKVAMLLGSVMLLTACGDSNNTTKNSSESVNSESTAETTVASSTEITGTVDTAAEGDTGAALGETVDVGGVKYTVTAVSFTDDRNQEADSQPSNVIKIDYTVENGTDEEIPIGADFTVYDAAGTQMETYPLDSTMGSLAPGKNLNGTEYWGLEQTGNVEIMVMPMNDWENDPAIYSIPIE